MAADIVGNDRQLGIAAIGPQHVAGREMNLAVVVERASVRQTLATVRRERHQVAGLAAFDVDEAQPLAAREPQAGAAAGGNDVSLGHASDVTSRGQQLTRFGRERMLLFERAFQTAHRAIEHGFCIARRSLCDSDFRERQQRFTSVGARIRAARECFGSAQRSLSVRFRVCQCSGTQCDRRCEQQRAIQLALRVLCAVPRHDGRSINLREVILRHGGEALQSRNAFAALPEIGKAAMLEFLNSLVLFPPDDTASNLDPGNPSAPNYPQHGHGSISLSVLFNSPTDLE